MCFYFQSLCKWVVCSVRIRWCRAVAAAAAYPDVCIRYASASWWRLVAAAAAAHLQLLMHTANGSLGLTALACASRRWCGGVKLLVLQVAPAPVTQFSGPIRNWPRHVPEFGGWIGTMRGRACFVVCLLLLSGPRDCCSRVAPVFLDGMHFAAAFSPMLLLLIFSLLFSCFFFFFCSGSLSVIALCFFSDVTSPSPSSRVEVACGLHFFFGVFLSIPLLPRLPLLMWRPGILQGGVLF